MIQPSPTTHVHAPRSKARAAARLFASDNLRTRQSSLRAAGGYAGGGGACSNRNAPPASLSSSVPSITGTSQLAPVHRRCSCVDRKSPLDQRLSHRASESDFRAPAHEDLHPRRSGRPPVAADLRGNPAGSRAERAPARRARRPAAVSAAAPPGSASPPCPASQRRAIHGARFQTGCIVATLRLIALDFLPSVRPSYKMQVITAYSLHHGCGTSKGARGRKTAQT